MKQPKRKNDLNNKKKRKTNKTPRKINHKIGIPITTISVKLELLRIRPDLSKLSSNGIYEYIYIGL